jgi:Coenzyme PQQ synthesis protein D (PqqD)
MLACWWLLQVATGLIAERLPVNDASCNLCVLECPAMTISFSDRVSVPDDVLISNLQEESVILNLDSERYFGLDDVGTRILSVLTTSDSIEAAYEKLAQEYDVDGAVLRRDLLALVEDLVKQGIVQVRRS